MSEIIGSDIYEDVQRVLYPYIIIEGVGRLDTLENLDMFLETYGFEADIQLWTQAFQHYLGNRLGGAGEAEKSSPPMTDTETPKPTT
jgi:hypothetical protein